MKLAVNAWAISEKLGFAETFAAVKAAGYDGIELNVDASGAHSLTMETTPDECEQILELSRKVGLPVTSISTSISGEIASDDPEKRESAKAVLLKQLHFARLFGADAILTAPGFGKTDWGRAHENLICAFRDLKPEIDSYGIKIGIEHVWNGFFLSPRDLCYSIDAIGNPLVGVYFDVANCADRSDSADWIRFLGKRILRMHIKNFNRKSVFEFSFPPLYEEGTIDWKSAIGALNEIGYSDVVTAEFGAPEGDPGEKLSRSYQAILKILQA